MQVGCKPYWECREEAAARLAAQRQRLQEEEEEKRKLGEAKAAERARVALINQVRCVP